MPWRRLITILPQFRPYVYLAGDRLEAIAAKHGATITYKPVDAVALFARTGGLATGAAA